MMEQKHLLPVQAPSNAAELVTHAAGLQAKSTDQLSALVEKMAEIVLVMDARLKTLEGMLQQRVTVSGAQTRDIMNAVKLRSASICEKNGLTYATVGRYVREAVWRAFRAEYRVSSPHDLPAIYFENAISFVMGWTSFSLIRRLRDREPTNS